MRFHDLQIGDRFRFEHDSVWFGLASGPWIKLTARKYRHDPDDTYIHKVGSINIRVETIPANEEP